MDTKLLGGVSSAGLSLLVLFGAARSSMSKVKCTRCGTENDMTTSTGYCFQCGRDLPGTAGALELEAAQQRLAQQEALATAAKLEAEPIDPTERAFQQVEATAQRETAITLLAVGLLPLACGVSVWMGQERMPDLAMLLDMAFGVVVFAGLALWAWHQPLWPAMLGLGLYIVLSLLWLGSGPGVTAGLGLILRIAFICFLARAVKIAREYDQLRRSREQADQDV